MPSPFFPGMDPYLEHPTLWHDVHLELIHAIRAALVPQVAPRYFVAVETVELFEPSAELGAGFGPVIPRTLIGQPDVAIAGQPQSLPAPPISGAPAAVLERPITVQLPALDRIRERYLEIRDATTYEVITVIEILSPTNKRPGEDRRQYGRKRRQVLDALTNLVEIDLLRDGEPMPMGPIPRSHYRILVSRGWERPDAKLYPFNLNEPIPEIPIPLREGETEPTLSLGELLAQVYDQVRYDLRIDYTAEPEPPLDPSMTAWSHNLLHQAGRR